MHGQEDLNKFYPNLKSKSISNEENVAFLDLKLNLIKVAPRVEKTEVFRKD